MNTHHSSKPLARHLAAACLTLALSACGGGGSTGSDSTSASADALVITSDNAEEVAKAGVAAGGAAGIAQAMHVGTVGSAAAARQTALGQARRAHALALSMVGARSGAAAAATIACADSGSMHIEVDTGSNAALDAVGEFATLTASNCADGDGLLLNGTFTLSITGYTDANNQQVSLDFSSLSTTEIATGSALRLSGSMSLAVSGGNRYTVSAPALTLVATISGSSARYVLNDFSALQVVGASSTQDSAQGDVTLATLGAMVHVTTPTVFVTLSTDEYPSSGQMVLAGANGSSVRVLAVDASTARISVDANGDGSYESSRDVAWSELD